MGTIYVARRRLKIGTEIREIGSQVPEAEGWPRVEAWERSGFLNKIEGEYDAEPKVSDLGEMVAPHIAPKPKKAVSKRAAKKTTAPKE